MIIKFQQGGGALPPLVSYQPVTVSGAAAASTAAAPVADKAGKSDLTDKDLLEMLKGLDGLPSDMQVITSTLQNFYIDQSSGFSKASTANIASKYLQILNQMKTANFHKKQYDEAFSIVKSNGGINEVAIDERGRFICVNSEGDFKFMSAEQLKNQEEYQPMTNSELLEYRAYNKDTAFNNNILSIVQSGIGMEYVNKLVQDIISKLGTAINSESAYVTSEAKKVLRGVDDFNKAIQNSDGSFNPTINNLYKYKHVDKNQAEQMQAAFNYIFRTLPENAKALLKYKSQQVEGGLESLLGQLISSQHSYTSEFSLDLDNPTSSKSSKSSSKTGTGISGFDMDPVSMLQAGYGETEDFVIQTAAGGTRGIEINTVRMPITKKSGESIGAQSTLNDVSESAFAGYLNFENASMGGVMIPTVGFNNIAVNGTALYTAYLPVDLAEYSRTGNIKPDIAMLGRYKQAQTKIKDENITDPNKINAVYQEFGLPIMYNENGDILTSYKKFGMINATALSDAFDEDVDFEDYLYETLDENTINNTLAILQKGRSDKDRIDFDPKGIFDSKGGDGYDRVYKGVVFIPVNQNHFTATAATGNYPTTSEAEVIEAKQQAAAREEMLKNSYVNPGKL